MEKSNQYFSTPDMLIIAVPANVRRALEVANRAGQLLVIVGHDHIFAELNAHHFTPCPCGNYGQATPLPCICEPDAVIAHQHKIKRDYVHAMFVEAHLPWRSYKFSALNGPSTQLLKYAHAERGLTAYEIITIMASAVAIAALDNTDVIRVEHVAEAVSYHPKL